MASAPPTVTRRIGRRGFAPPNRAATHPVIASASSTAATVIGMRVDVDRRPGPMHAFRRVALDHVCRPSRGVVERAGGRALRRREGQRSGKLEQLTACEAHEGTLYPVQRQT